MENVKSGEFMGGNIWENNLRIWSKEAFQELIKKQQDLFENITDKLYIPREIDSKSTFGDLDIIVPLQFLQPMVSLVKSLELPLSINTNVISYQYESYQVDLIFLEEKYIPYAINYFSFGDHGNVLGRLSKRHGLKTGFKGLSHTFIRDQGNTKIDIPVSMDYTEMLEYLKYDSNKFKEGFKDESDLFEWLTSSPYFDPTIYSFESMINKDRVRDRKRKFYRDFLDHINARSYPEPQEPPPFELVFQDFQPKFDAINDEYNLKVAYRNKFNGNIVSKISGREGMALGVLMRDIRSKYDQEAILKLSEDELKDIILQLN